MSAEVKKQTRPARRNAEQTRKIEKLESRISKLIEGYNEGIISSHPFSVDRR